MEEPWFLCASNQGSSPRATRVPLSEQPRLLLSRHAGSSGKATFRGEQFLLNCLQNMQHSGTLGTQRLRPDCTVLLLEPLSLHNSIFTQQGDSAHDLARRPSSLDSLSRSRRGQRDVLHPCQKAFSVVSPVDFEILDQIEQAETFAQGSAIREIGRLRKQYGDAHWRKRKGIATVRLKDGTVRRAEIHWYEAAGIGKREFKIKYYLD